MLESSSWEFLWPPVLPFLGSTFSDLEESQTDIDIDIDIDNKDREREPAASIELREVSSPIQQHHNNNTVLHDGQDYETNNINDSSNNSNSSIATDNSASPHYQSNISNSRHSNTKWQTKTSWRQLLQSNRTLYEFSCWTGVIYPTLAPLDSAVPPLYTDQEISFRQYWVIFLHAFLTIEVLLGLFNIITIPLILADAVGWAFVELLWMTWFTSLIPIFTMCAGLVLIRKNIMQPQICSNGSSKVKQIERAIFETSVASGVAQCWQLIKLFFTVSILYMIVQMIQMKAASRAFTGTFPLILEWADYCGMVLSIIPIINMNIGVYGFTTIEQRISRSLMLDLRSLAMQSKLTDKYYLQIGKIMEERDKRSPLSWIFAGAAIVSLTSIGLLLATAFGSVAGEQSSSVFAYVSVMAFKEIVLLLLILYEVLKVNEMVDTMLIQVTRCLFDDSEDDDDDEQKDKVKVSNRVRRLELYVIMREYKIGSTILTYRPSKFQLIVQITSIITAILSSVLKIVTKNLTG